MKNRRSLSLDEERIMYESVSIWKKMGIHFK